MLRPDFFGQFPDGHFSHVFCSSHLIRLPPGPDKLACLEHLKRMGRNLVVFERMPHQDRAEPSHRHPEDFIATQGLARRFSLSLRQHSLPREIAFTLHPAPPLSASPHSVSIASH